MREGSDYMISGEDSARGRLSSWWRSVKSTSSARVEPQIELPSQRHPLVLWLDDSGHVIRCSQALAERLQTRSVLTGVHVRELVRQGFDWFDRDVSEWPAAIPLLTFIEEHRQDLSCAAVVERDLEEWRLILVDISDQSERLRRVEGKALLMKRTAELAMQIAMDFVAVPLNDDGLHTLAGLVNEGALADWLELLSLRLKFPWAALGVVSNEQYYVCGIYQRPGLAEGLPGGAFIQRKMREKQGDGFSSSRMESGEPFLLFPYLDAGRPVAWLCMGEHGARDGNDLLSDEDWHCLFSMVANPMLRAMQQLNKVMDDARWRTIEQLRSGGWWEFRPEKGCMRLAPSLVHQLALPRDVEWLSEEQWLGLIDPVDRDAFHARLASVQPGRFAMAARLLLNSEVRWYQWEGDVVDGPGGRFIVGFTLDIHDMKMREEEAAFAKSRLQGLIDSAPGMIYVMDYSGGALEFSFCSASIDSLLGWGVDAFLERPFASYIHTEDLESYFNHTRDLLTRGRASSHYRMRHADGTYKWIQDEALLLRNERGMPVEVVGLCLDVNESRMAAERVAASEERYRALVEESPAIICRYSPDLRTTFANRMLITSLGLPLPEGYVIDEPLDLSDFISPEDRDKALRRFETLTPADPHANFEVRVRRTDGRYRWWIVSERGLFDSHGQLIEIQAVARDDTELHDARLQLSHSAKMATLGQMATGLAHEISQPLNVMHMSASNLLTRLSRNEADREYLVHKMSRIVDQIQRTAIIVDHMRVFGRQSDIEGVSFNPQESVAGALLLIGERLVKDGVELHVVEGEMPMVVGHPDRLVQVLLNLMLNALYAVLERRRYDASHQPRIILECIAKEKTAVIRVRDNGVGMRPEIFERLFEPFFTTKPVGDGTGLGLSVSYSIIKQMSGKLYAENTGEGAMFTIELPIESVPAMTHDRRPNLRT